MATAAGANGSFHGCWRWCSLWRIGSASTHVAPLSRLANTSDHILCLVALSLTHINNIWLFEWLVALVEGMRESHFGTITGDFDCDCWILAQSWYWVFVWMYFIIVHVWMWLKSLENHSTISTGAQKKPIAVSMRSWGPKRHAPRACRNQIKTHRTGQLKSQSLIPPSRRWFHEDLSPSRYGNSALYDSWWLFRKIENVSRTLGKNGQKSWAFSLRSLQPTTVTKGYSFHGLVLSLRDNIVKTANRCKRTFYNKMVQWAFVIVLYGAKSAP